MVSFFDEVNADVVPLITCQNGKYEICADTLQWFEDQNKRKIVIIACAGKYRTGKSFLLNRLAQAPSNKGFGVGNTVQACTKGLWVYKHFFPTEEDDKFVLYIDTEGIDALDANDTHDVRIFTLALLLSSVFLYNSVGTIDETAMQTLSLMTRVTNNVKVSSASSNCDNISEHMPHFIWVLRDFGLKLEDKDGKTLTSNEYLEHALLTSDPSKDEVRSAIRSSFPKRCLITLPRPSTDDNQQLEDRLFSVSSKFTASVDDLRKHLFGLDALKMGDKSVSGTMFCALCKHMTETVQTNAVPVIRDSWTLMAQVQNRDLRSDLLESLQETIESMSQDTLEIITDQLQAAYDVTIDTFDRQAINPVDVDVKTSLVEQAKKICCNAMDTLVRDVGEIINGILDAIEGDILEDPNTLHSSIERCERKFLEENGENDKMREAWNLRVHRRVYTKWYLPIVQFYQTERDKKTSELQNLRESYSLLEQKYDNYKQTFQQEHSLKISEFDQSLLSNKEVIDELTAHNTELQNKIAYLEIEKENFDRKTDDGGTASSESVDNSSSESVIVDKQQQDYEEEVGKLKLEKIAIQNTLSSKLEELSRIQQEYEDLKDQSAQKNTLYQTLEKNWNEGLKELNAEKTTLSNQLRLVQQNFEDEKLKANQIRQSMEDKISQIKQDETILRQMHEREKTQIEEMSTRYREQCEAAQQRVLDIHRSMLEDTRKRDEKLREQEAANLKERMEYQNKNAELLRENERVKEVLNGQKRKIGELEHMEQECKRYRQKDQEQTMKMTRYETELVQHKQLLEKNKEERERFRQENMKMEGELAVLKAEKQLADARKDLKKNQFSS